jgi:hypothetical protein
MVAKKSHIWKYRKYIIAQVVIYLMSVSYIGFGQMLAPTQTEFGQNRIQKKEFNWKVLTSSNFELYFYGDTQTLAQNAIVYAESEFERLSSLLGYSPYARTKVFFYNSPADMFQSNASLNHAGEINQLESNLSKSKIEVAYTGDFSSFKKTFVNKISEIFVFEMLYGGSLKDALQSSILLTLPEWFISGITAYAANGWNNQMDDFMRDAILKKRMKRPDKLTGDEAKLFGQSIWNYIAEKYGKDNISNILNLTRIIRNEQTSIGSTLGTSYSKFLKDWRDFYAQQTNTVTGNYSPMRAELKIKPDGKLLGSNMVTGRLNTDQGIITYITQEQGQYKVWNYAIKTKKNVQLLKVGIKNFSKNQDPSNAPKIAWAKKTNTLVIIYEKDGETRLQIHKNILADKLNGNITTRKVLKNLVQINAIDLNTDGKTILMSAVKKGQNDLFEYDIARGGTTQLTNDIFDDRNPSYIPGSRSIIYLSNQSTDSTQTSKGYKAMSDYFGIYRHSGDARDATITQLADSLGNIGRPIASDDSTLIFLSDERGINNLYRYAKGDSTFQKINQISNSLSNIYDYDYNPATGALVYLTYENGEPYIGYIRRLNTETEYELPRLPRSQAKAYDLNKLLPPSPELETSQTDTNTAEPENTSKMQLAPGEIDTDNYKFDQTSVQKQDARIQRSNRNTGVIIKSSARRDSRIKGPADFQDKIELVNFDNNFVVDPLRKFGWKNTVVFSDVLQNQIIKAGLMITPKLNNSDFFAEYTNYKKRVDFALRLDRRSYFEEEFDNQDMGRKMLYNKLMATASYPISTASRVSVSPFVMNASTKYVNSIASNTGDRFTGWQIEYVYDKTSQIGINQLEGTRLKIRHENVNGITSAKQSFNKLSVDLRNYTKITQGIILATRLSFGRSTGRSPKQYLLGGMDNWVQSRSDYRPEPENPLSGDFSIDNRNELLFADFVTNMRGFTLNKVSGNNHAVINAELRFPVFKYLGNKQSSSNALNNFQAIMFTDVGTVWNKRSPFAAENDFNTKPILNSLPFTGHVTDFKSPILAGYGVGARTSILGYFVKLDLAWGVDDQVVQKPITYLTIGLDF